ncbi:hypothetical protein Acr_00g0002150 [Actinidia rufa]|nr:hypothetical protein Acr_00g0002150 [Actinidia rufa]
MFMATPYVQFGEVLAPLYDSRPVSQRPILFAPPAATSVPTPVLKTTQRQPCTINSKKATPIKPIHKPASKTAVTSSTPLCRAVIPPSKLVPHQQARMKKQGSKPVSRRLGHDPRRLRNNGSPRQSSFLWVELAEVFLPSPISKAAENRLAYWSHSRSESVLLHQSIACPLPLLAGYRLLLRLLYGFFQLLLWLNYPRLLLSLLFCQTACPLFTAGYSLLLADQVKPVCLASFPFTPSAKSSTLEFNFCETGTLTEGGVVFEMKCCSKLIPEVWHSLEQCPGRSDWAGLCLRRRIDFKLVSHWVIPKTALIVAAAPTGFDGNESAFYFYVEILSASLNIGMAKRNDIVSNRSGNPFFIGVDRELRKESYFTLSSPADSSSLEGLGPLTWEMETVVGDLSGHIRLEELAVDGLKWLASFVVDENVCSAFVNFADDVGPGAEPKRAGPVPLVVLYHAGEGFKYPFGEKVKNDQTTLTARKGGSRVARGPSRHSTAVGTSLAGDRRHWLMAVRTTGTVIFLRWGDRDSCSPNLSPRAGILKQAPTSLRCSARSDDSTAGKRESSVIGSIISIMEMLCRRASLAVSSFARDSTGTKDLNGIEELSRCYLKNEETTTERERVKGLDFPLCHYLAQHICREQEHIQVSYEVESDLAALAALTTETKERSKIRRPKSRRFSRRNKRRPVARPSPKKNFLGEARKHSCAPLHSPSILYRLLVPSASA